MALPSSGPISWAMIRAEFGGGNPVYASQYYRGAGLVPNSAANSAVPTSGRISAANFYGATKATQFSASLSNPVLEGSWPQTTTGTLYADTNVLCSGGSGSYSIVSSTITSGLASITASGLNVTVSASGRNQERSGTFRVVVTDGTTNITLNGDYYFNFGVPK